ncbi:endoglucanase E-4-like [Gigantopelta aegis]|uniref:endoglucanase E-4-like n=1 Tax=Gigantopelta aegis TaxID=1735272 RepID=UPI001B88E145|nr:endoglucanase E-4-like [Gigantopelta aegis]
MLLVIERRIRFNIAIFPRWSSRLMEDTNGCFGTCPSPWVERSSSVELARAGTHRRCSDAEIVGDIAEEQDVWTRPEDLTTSRRSYSLTPSKPGSDVAGNTAAALAAGSIAFKNKDATYATTLLKAAVSLYEFASSNLGKYNDNMPPEVNEAYGSSGYKDELALAAVWLYKATWNRTYLEAAVRDNPTSVPWALEWDDKTASAALLIYEQNGEQSFRTLVEDFLASYMPGGSVPYTPCGLAFRTDWGSLRYSANVVMLALFAAEILRNSRAESYRSWAYGQITYMLGDNNYNMSYLIGYSDLYPLRPHHKAASCPVPPKTCDWPNFEMSDPNTHVLYGALVGGPGSQDDYNDVRSDFKKNEVAVDYNSGFQAAVAGLLHLQLNGTLPEPSRSGCPR